MPFRFTSALALILLQWTALFLVPSSADAQQGSFLLSDAKWPSKPFYPPPSPNRSNGVPDTLSIGTSNPFFDDFSYPGILPDSQKWFIPDSGQLFNTPPTLTRGMAIGSPTAGVATFNGAKSDGRPYLTGSFSSGKNDQLISHCLDLSAYSPADNIWLSFALQPQGRAEAPEPSDTFSVFFINSQDTVRALTITGQSNRPFKNYALPINQSGFFSRDFQVVFETWGSLNGALDYWHLDYVYLGLNRQAADTIFDDRSVTLLTRPIFDPYSALPAKLYQQGFGSMQPFEVETNNLAANPTQVTLSTQIIDQSGNNSFTGQVSQSLAINLPAQGMGVTPFNPFDNQSLSTVANAQLTINLDQPADAFSGNDTLRYSFRMDSILAIDDGEADQVFGMNAPRGFGTLVETGRPDSLTGVWIRFVPLVNIRQNLPQYMEGRAFRIVLWKDPHPDSVIIRISGGQLIQYGEAPNQYIRYPFTEPIEVPGKFWIGIQQFDALPVGVGFDRTYGNPNLTFYDSAGTWRTTGLNGSLMIRPEFFSDLGQPLGLQNGPTRQLPFAIFPNPIQNGLLNYRLKTGQPFKNVVIQIFDLQGRIIGQYHQRSDLVGSIRLPENLANGRYLVRMQAETQSGDLKQGTQSIIVE